MAVCHEIRIKPYPIFRFPAVVCRLCCWNGLCVTFGRTKLADPRDASQGDLSKRIHFLKCEPEGEEPMCAITQSFVEEGEIIGVVKYMRKRGATDNEILAEIKEEYGLDDFEAQSFVRGTIDQVVAV